MAWRESPDTFRMVFRILGIGVDFRSRLKLETRLGRNFLDRSFGHIALFYSDLRVTVIIRTVLHHTEDTARFQDACKFIKNCLRLSTADPAMGIAKGDDDVDPADVDRTQVTVDDLDQAVALAEAVRRRAADDAGTDRVAAAALRHVGRERV